MCHNSGVVQNAQIERFVEHGMPQKIVKTVKYTLRKRAQEQSSLRGIVDYIDCDTVSEEEESTSCFPTKTACSLESTPDITTTTTTAATATATPIILPTVLPTESNVEILEKRRIELKIPKLCGRFLQMQQQHQKDNQSSLSASASVADSSSPSENSTVYVDALAVGTQLTKQFARRLNCAVQKLQSSKIFTILTSTTQPAHIIAIGILSFVLLTLWPELIDEKALDKTDVGGSGSHTLAAIAYLGAFATHFGAQIWMTFVSGLSLYFSLPRHTFGQCQQILFPKYFALNSALSISMLILYVKYFLSSWSSFAGCVQLVALALTAVIEVAVRLYAAPPLLRLMHEKYKIEGAIGSGREVGDLVQGDLVQCPHYQRIHKAFRRIHMTVAIGNMTVLLATCLHLYFLALKIQIS